MYVCIYVCLSFRWSQTMCFVLKAGYYVVVTDIKQCLTNSER